MWYRAVANIIDGTILAILLIPLVSAGSDVHTSMAPGMFFGVHSSNPFSTSLAIIIAFAYFIGCIRYQQATIGMRVLHIRMVNYSGKTPEIPQILIWMLARILSTIILYIGFLMMLWTERRQGLHDQLADILFIRES